MILGRVLPGAREIAWHEAYHAAALCLAGMVPKCVRTDWPSDLEAGEVAIDWGPGRLSGRGQGEGRARFDRGRRVHRGGQGWDWDNWPIDPWKVAEGGRGDAVMARELVEHFNLPVVDWLHVLWLAEKLCRRRDFRRLVVRIADELERVELLYADDLRALMEPEEGAVAA